MLAEVAILSDSDLALRALERELRDHKADTAAAQARAKALRAQLDGLLTAPQRAHQRFLAAVQQALPGVIVVGDSNQPVYSCNLIYQAGTAALLLQLEHRLRHAGLWPAGRARRQAGACASGRWSSLIGDGGLQFTIGELATAVELELCRCRSSSGTTAAMARSRNT